MNRIGEFIKKKLKKPLSFVLCGAMALTMLGSSGTELITAFASEPGITADVEASSEDLAGTDDFENETEPTEGVDENSDEDTVDEGTASEDEELYMVEENDDTDIVLSNYICENVNKKYVASADKMDLANVIFVKNTIFDGNYVEKSDTLDSVMGGIEEGDASQFVKYVSQISGYSAVYDLDDDSDYYVAYVNSMMDEANVQDVAFAKNTNNGDAITDCIYDSKTGICYIPKSNYVEDDGTTYIFCGVQIQLMQVINSGLGDGNENISSDITYSIADANEEQTDVYSTSADIFSFETTVETDAGLKDDDITVTINGVPVTDDLWSYDSSTGEITLEVSSASVNTVCVDIDEGSSTLIGKIKSTLHNASEPSVAYAASYTDETPISSWDDMKTLASNVELPSWVTTGTALYGNMDMAYSTTYQDEAGHYSYAYGYDFDSNGYIDPGTEAEGYTNSDVYKMFKYFVENGKFNSSSYSKIIYETLGKWIKVKFSGNTLKYVNSISGFSSFDFDNYYAGDTEPVGESVPALADLGELALECGHILSTAGYTGDDYSGDVRTFVSEKALLRFLYVDTEDQFAIVGIVTTSMEEQSGVGIFKIGINTTGYAQVKKVASSSTDEITEGNCNYSLEGAVYGVYTNDSCTIAATDVDGNTVTLTTDEDGNTEAVELNSGTYYVKEISASPGYSLDTTVHTVDVGGGDTATVTSTEKASYDPLSITLTKIDQDTGESSAQGGASLAGAQFTVKFYAVDPDEYDTIDKLNEGIENGEITDDLIRTWVIETDEDAFASLDEDYLVSGSDDLYYDEYGAPVLPIGVLTVEETKAPDGYTTDGMYYVNPDTEEVTDGTVWFGQVIQGEDMAQLSGGNEYTISDRVMRGDFSFTKVDTDRNPLEGIPFTITSENTGESHTVYTDSNGYYSTDSAYIAHSENTNGGDNGDEGAGIWFGTGDVDDSVGALPYDTYLVEEQSCEANADKKLVSFEVTISIDEYKVDMGTIVDNDSPGLSTNAKDEDSGTKYMLADTGATILDTISYSDMTKGQSYKVVTKLWDATDGAFLKDSDGNEITETTDFTAGSKGGTLDIEVTFDASNLAGHDVVVFEYIYDSDNSLVTSHDDATDTNQTVHFPEIGTSAVDAETTIDVSNADEQVTIIDTVDYSNVKAGWKYTITGTLYYEDTGEPVTDANGKEITGSTTFTADSTEGSVEVTFGPFDGSLLAGKSVVAGETLEHSSRTYAVHYDMTDEEQTVHFPEIGTNAYNAETGEQMAPADSEVTINDDISYSNMDASYSYTVEAMVYDMTTKSFISGSDGEPLTWTMDFTPEDSDGTVTMPIDIDTEGLAGDTLVVYEYVYYDNDGDEELVGSHENPDDESQQIHIPEIGTHATDSETGLGLSMADGDITITDRVTYSNLIPGKEYTISGTLYLKDDSDEGSYEMALDDSGNAITAEETFTPEESDGYVDITFSFSGVNLAGSEVVAFEDLTRKGYSYAVHADINDEDQTVYIPEIHTTATDSSTGIGVGYDGDEVTIVDTVAYDHLLPGVEYTMTGTLYDQSTGEPFTDAEGNEATASYTFTPDTSSGTVTLEFTINGSGLEGTSLVAFESLAYDGKIVANHEDITDEGQTVHFVEIGTTAYNAETGEQMAPADSMVTIDDDVAYSNIDAGYTYTVEAMVYDIDTKSFISGEDGTPMTWTMELDPGDSEGTATMEISFDSSGLAGDTVVVYEYVYYNDVLVGSHENPEDGSQQVHFPEIGTHATDSETGINVSESDEDITVVDRVTYSNLIPGKEYTVTGTLYLKNGTASESVEDPEDTEDAIDGEDAEDGDTVDSEEPDDENLEDEDLENEDLEDENLEDGDLEDEDLEDGDLDDEDLGDEDLNEADGTGFVKALDDNGEPIIATATFTPEESDGYVDIEFNFSGVNLAGKAVVAFEDLSYNGYTYAVHADIEDEDQTDYIPEIRTTAVGSDTLDHITKGSTETAIVDTVAYESLPVGQDFIMEGTLMYSDGTPVLDADGNPVTAEQPFTTETTDGTVQVVFTFDASDMLGDTVVAFEDLLTVDGTVVAVHEDIEDEGQSVRIPAIHTTASDMTVIGEDGEEVDIKVANPDDGPVTVKDVVDYHNLIPGYEYTISGVLMDKETGEPLTDADGNAVTASSTFTAEAEDGSEALYFTVDGLESAALVAFESLTLNGVEIAEHKDIDDLDQSAYIPEIGTTLIDSVTGDHISYALGEQTLIDTVEYHDLYTGYEYTMKGVLMDKETGEALTVNGAEVTAEKTFTPEESGGSVELEFTFDATGLEDHDVVAYEFLYLGDYLTASHTDITDESQTVHFPGIKTYAVATATGLQRTFPLASTKLVDNVYYSNLLPGLEYTVTGTAYILPDDADSVDPDTDEPLIIGGEPVTSTVTFTPDKADGMVEVPFEIDATDLAGQTIVFFEDITLNGSTVVREHLNDPTEEIEFAEVSIGTTASETDTGDKDIEAGKVSITDVIEYTDLIPGLEYKVSGTMMDKKTGKAIDGAVAEATFTPDEEDGTVSVVFSIDATDLAGHTLVAFEELDYDTAQLDEDADEDYVTIAEHKDLKDEAQSVDIITPPSETKTGDTNLPFAAGTATVIALAALAAALAARKRRRAA